jgi:hypothetical protein
LAAKDSLFVVGAAGAGQTSPTEARLALGGLVTPAGTGVAVRGGTFYGPGTPGLVSGTGSMAYSVAAGQFVVTRSAATLGPYLGANDGATTVNTTAAPGTVGQSRWDLIWYRQPDAEQGDANSTAVFGVTQGTASGSPAKPYGSVPAGALVLAEALVPQGATQTSSGVTITQVAPWTVATGAPVPVRSQAERDAMTTYSGLTVYRIDTTRTEQYDGSTWRVIHDPGAWRSYTPTWTAVTTNPTVGNGTLSGKYLLVGRRVEFRIAVTWGSTTNNGSGVYRWAEPLPSANYATPVGEPIGQATLYDTSAGDRYTRTAYMTTAGISLTSEAAGLVSGINPWTWANGDALVITGSYETT